VSEKKYEINLHSMFDFEKLDVYQDLRKLNLKTLQFLYGEKKLDSYLIDQFKRASLSVLFNLAEGTGRMSRPDKKHFYIVARSSIFECVAILQVLFDLRNIDEHLYNELYEGFAKASRMLLGLIRSLA